MRNKVLALNPKNLHKQTISKDLDRLPLKASAAAFLVAIATRVALDSVGAEGKGHPDAHVNKTVTAC